MLEGGFKEKTQLQSSQLENGSMDSDAYDYASDSDLDSDDGEECQNDHETEHDPRFVHSDGTSKPCGSIALPDVAHRT